MKSYLEYLLETSKLLLLKEKLWIICLCYAVDQKSPARLCSYP